MNKSILLSVTFVLLLGGCATTPQSTLSVAPEIRSVSQADETLFRDILGAVGGVGFMNRVFYPQAKQSSVVRIEVVTPYNNGQAGVERWHIQNDANDIATYIVTLKPDGKGGTFFSVQRDQPGT
jgi:hypothetical protein